MAKQTVTSKNLRGVRAIRDGDTTFSTTDEDTSRRNSSEWADVVKAGLPGQYWVRERYRSRFMQMGIALAIFFNFIIAAVRAQVLFDEGEPLDSDDTPAYWVFYYSEFLFTSVFFLELLFNMYAHFLLAFWKDPWNIFDVLIVVTSVTSLIMPELPAVAVLRLFRAFRAFRLVRRIASLRVIVVGAMKCLPSVSAAFVILLMIMGIWSIMAVEFFGTREFCEDNYGGFEDKDLCGNMFGKFSMAMLTMFQVMTLDSWSSGITRPMVLNTRLSISRLLVAFFFVSYVFATAIILTNVVVALLLDKFLKATEELIRADILEQCPDEAAVHQLLAPQQVKERLMKSVRNIKLLVEVMGIESLDAHGAVQGVTTAGLEAKEYDPQKSVTRNYFDDGYACPSYPSSVAKDYIPDDIIPGERHPLIRDGCQNRSNCKCPKLPALAGGYASIELQEVYVVLIQRAWRLRKARLASGFTNEPPTCHWLDEHGMPILRVAHGTEADVEPLKPSVENDAESEVPVPVSRRMSTLFPYPTCELPFQEEVNQFYWHPTTQLCTAAIIFTNFFVSAAKAELNPLSDLQHDVFKVFEIAFALLFSIELVVNMYGHFWWKFWQSMWNVFDFVVVIVSNLAVIYPGMPGISVLRLFRAFRAFRLFKRVGSMRTIISCVIKSLPRVSYAFLILIMIMGIWSIMAVEIFGETFPDEFGNFFLAMLSMFQVVTFDSWSSGIARPVIIHHGLSSGVFFATYVFVASIIMMNVVIAIFVDQFLGSASSEESALGTVLVELEHELMVALVEVQNRMKNILSRRRKEPTLYEGDTLGFLDGLVSRVQQIDATTAAIKTNLKNTDVEAEERDHASRRQSVASLGSAPPGSMSSLVSS